MTDEATRRATIARLNDEFRFTGKGGEMFMTSGIAALPLADKLLILADVRYFADFNSANDPHGEHDCALLTVRSHTVIWKIDYLPADGLDEADPADPATTNRMLTIMLAGEY
ncbi:hypothetical protein BV96_01117 [Sphingomonas paucimobilis]|nr:hypothetical protein BV96_01117 [Sphingomonas paucimobilis]